MNEALGDTDNPSHLHLDLESNIFFLQKTYLPNYSLLDTMLQSVYSLYLRRKSLEKAGELPQIQPRGAQAEKGPPASGGQEGCHLPTRDCLDFSYVEYHLKS